MNNSAAFAILFRQQDIGQVNVTIRNSSFISASGLDFDTFYSMSSELKDSSFLGNGRQHACVWSFDQRFETT